MVLMAAVFGVCEGGLALVGAAGAPVALAMLVMAAVGFAMSTTMALANTTVQSITPDALRGRVMSIYMTVFAGTTPIGALVAGVSARFLGAPASIAIGGATVVLAAAGVGVWGVRLARGAPLSMLASVPAHPAD